MKRLAIRRTGLALGVFFAATFTVCVLWGLIVPARWEPMAGLWEALLPGFVWLTPASFVLGLLEALLYGFYVAVIFVPLFNYFERSGASTDARPMLHLREEAGK